MLRFVRFETTPTHMPINTEIAQRLADPRDNQWIIHPVTTPIACAPDIMRKRSHVGVVVLAKQKSGHAMHHIRLQANCGTEQCDAASPKRLSQSFCIECCCFYMKKTKQRCSQPRLHAFCKVHHFLFARKDLMYIATNTRNTEHFVY